MAEGLAEDADPGQVLRDLEEWGWTIGERGADIVLDSRTGRVAVPLATRIAPGVYRLESGAPVEARSAELEERRATFAALRELFSRYPCEGDSTAIIREMRDSR